MFLRLQFFLVLFVLFPFGAAVSQAASADIQAIESVIHYQDFDKAVELSRSALKRSPNDARLWVLDGIALSASGHKKEALSAYNSALEISPNYIPALEGAAELEYNAGNDHAAVLLKRILKVRPDSPTAHAMLGVLDYKQNDCPSAVQHFQAANAVLASQPSALVEYGSCLVSLERAEEALPIFQRLLELQPDDAHSRYNVAVVQISVHHPQDAIATLQPLMQNSQIDSDVLDLVSSAYEEAGDTPNAVKSLRQAIVQDPKKIDYYVDFAALCFAHQSFQLGVDMLNLGLAQNPQAAVLYVARGILYIQLAQYDKGEADFEMANKIDPRKSSGAVAEGLAKIQQSNPDQALATVRTQLKSHPNDAFLHYLEAQALFQKEPDADAPEFKEAIVAAEVAIKLRPSLMMAHDLLGNLYLKSGNLQKSISESRRTLQLNPSDQDAIYHLIQALRRTNSGDAELPALVKQLADLRQQSRDQEAQVNRYKLYEVR